MPEHEAIAHFSTLEMLDSLFKECDSFCKTVGHTMEENTPDRCASDQSRDYIMARSYNEGALDMARKIRDAVRDKIEAERQYYCERRAGYEEEDE